MTDINLHKWEDHLKMLKIIDPKEYEQHLIQQAQDQILTNLLKEKVIELEKLIPPPKELSEEEKIQLLTNRIKDQVVATYTEAGDVGYLSYKYKTEWTPESYMKEYKCECTDCREREDGYYE